MDRTAALVILEKLCAHWGIRLASGRHDAWMDTLTPLDEGTAGTTLARLRKRSDTKMPAPADFVAEYRSLHTAPPDPTQVCHRCGAHDAHGRLASTGWVTCTDHPHHHGHWHGREHMRPVLVTEAGPDPDACICNIVRPCPDCNIDARRHAA